MLFSSTVFLFAFLPIVLTVAFALPGVRARNAWLLAASLVFYAWGEARYTAVLLASIALNYGFGLAVDALRGRPAARVVVAAAVAANLAGLGVFKYAGFAARTWSEAVAALGWPSLATGPVDVHLPIGISFFTFQAICYVVDVHRGDARCDRNPLRVALYVALFPQLVAGPIVRFRDVAEALRARAAGFEARASGAYRFAIGLGKKALVADHVGVLADRVFDLPAEHLSASVAWLGAVAYALQIYFDFSGYSDMAIGIGRMLGFRFPENFLHPYASVSVREFWRRWHVSLSTWFRDYLYIPLGGSRGSRAATARNLLVVFALCGLWHGASFGFLVWGLLHGAFLSLERTAFGGWLARRPAPVGWVYTAAVVLVGWVVFRAETLGDALAYLAAMSGVGAAPGAEPLGLAWLEPQQALALAAGIAGAG
ncbi:MAG: MBOAT family protein, partial [Myxococcales bacterium]|nr:MBOAT family protein [Myxococcales bacterium]